MKCSQILLSAAFAAVAHGHSTVFNIHLNGVDQGAGNSASGYIRAPPNNNPVKDITSKDMTCNVNNVAVAKTVSAAAGDKVTFQWHHDSADASDDIIAASHKGPILVYIAPTSSNGEGDVWVKIAEEGYNSATGKWAVDNLIANKGQHSVALPSGLAAGEYLLRAEIIALHESDTAFNKNSARGAQFYPSCSQIKVTSGGSTKLPTGVSIPGVYTYSDPGVVFNLYGSFTSYTIPGPKVWSGSSSGSPAPASSTTVKPVATTAKPTTTKPAAVTTSAPVVVQPTTTSKAPVPTTTKSPAPSASVTKPAQPNNPAPTPSPQAPGTPGCGGPGGAPTTLKTIVAPPTQTGGAGGSSTIAKWGRCGGIGYTGSKTCVSGSECKVQNDYYSQCL